jgi:plasmid maintenance system antidote protein VapI
MFKINPADPSNPFNGFVQTTESFLRLTSSLGTQFKIWPNLELGYSLTLNDYQNTRFSKRNNPL